MNVAIHVRPIDENEYAELVRLLEHAAGRHPTAASLDDVPGGYPVDRALAIVEHGTVVGGVSSDVLELTVPGPSLIPATRATLAGVLPTYRGRGLASLLLREQLRDLRGRGEPLVVATTSVPGLTRRVGYAPSSLAVEVEVAPSQVRLDPGLPSAPGRLRTLESSEGRRLLPSLFDRHRIEQPGQVLRTEAFWRMWFLDRPLFRIGESDRFVVVYEDPAGAPQGYLTYRITSGSLRDQPVDEFTVEDLVATTGEARQALWRFCLTFSQARTVRAINVPADEQLAWLLSEPRGLRTVRVRDFLWLRLLDIATVLAARKYSAHGRVVLEVHDGVLSENTGTYEVAAFADGTSCKRSTAKVDLVLEVSGLAATFFGSATFTSLARLGIVSECEPGSLARADAMFAAVPGPWTVTDW